MIDYDYQDSLCKDLPDRLRLTAPLRYTEFIHQKTVEGVPSSELGKLFGVQAQTIIKTLARMGLSPLPRGGYHNVKTTLFSRSVIRRSRDRFSHREVAEWFDISPATVRAIREGKLWPCE